MRRLKLIWGAKRYGLGVGFASPKMLQNLRFADDLLLVARTLSQARHMLEDLMRQAGSAGLQVHMGKTKILCNIEVRRGVSAAKKAQIGTQEVEVLPFH